MVNEDVSNDILKNGFINKLSEINLKQILFRFINLVLLPRVRDDIAEYKRLNYHLYMVRAFFFSKHSTLVQNLSS